MQRQCRRQLPLSSASFCSTPRLRLPSLAVGLLCLAIAGGLAQSFVGLPLRGNTQPHRRESGRRTLRRSSKDWDDELPPLFGSASAEGTGATGLPGVFGFYDGEPYRFNPRPRLPGSKGTQLYTSGRRRRSSVEDLGSELNPKDSSAEVTGMMDWPQVLGISGTDDGLQGKESLDAFLARDLAERAQEMQVRVHSDVEHPVTIRMQKTLEYCPDGVLARELLGEALSEGEVPPALAYDLVLEALGSRGNTHDALDLFKEMQAAGVPATQRTYDALARPASRSGEWRYVEKLYHINGRPKGATSLAILLDAYVNGVPPQREKAEAVFREEVASTWDKQARKSPMLTPKVVAALRRAVGITIFRSLCKEFDLDAIGESDRPQGADDFC